MKTEVAKEVASRCQKIIHLYWSETAEERRLMNGGGDCKVTVSLQGWGDPCTFEMAGKSYMQQFNRVAQVVEARFTIKKLHFGGVGGGWNVIRCLRMIAGQVEEQGEEGLSELEIDNVFPLLFSGEVRTIFLSLVEASQVWRIQTLVMAFYQDGYIRKMWTELTNSLAKGHIGRAKFVIAEDHYDLVRPNLKFVKAVWEISEEVQVEDRPPIGGGRGRDPKITWEEAYETLLNKIC